jgi:hypothetical protein
MPQTESQSAVGINGSVRQYESAIRCTQNEKEGQHVLNECFSQYWKMRRGTECNQSWQCRPPTLERANTLELELLAELRDSIEPRALSGRQLARRGQTQTRQRMYLNRVLSRLANSSTTTPAHVIPDFAPPREPDIEGGEGGKT